MTGKKLDYEKELKEEIKELEEALKEEDFMDTHETHRLECETKLLKLEAELKGFQKAKELEKEKVRRLKEEMKGLKGEFALSLILDKHFGSELAGGKE